jgi:hypothetical protein
MNLVKPGAFGTTLLLVGLLFSVLPTARAIPETSEKPGASSRRTALVFSEILAHPGSRTDGRNLEFVEIFNSDPNPQDLSGFRLEGAITYTFPSGTSLAGRSYLVVAKVPGDVQAVAGISNVIGPYTGTLNQSSGEVLLRHRIGAVLLDTEYGAHRDRTAAADGAGHSLVLARPSLGEGNPRAWQASLSVNGSPGVAEPGSLAGGLESIYVNEVLGNPNSAGGGFVELYNRSNGAVDVSGCRIGAGGGTYVIPSGMVVPARGFVAFTETQLGLTLNAGLAGVFLWNPAGTRVLDALKFDGQEKGVSYGRKPDGSESISPLASASPGAANATAVRSMVVINELMYHPITENDDDGYVELYNRGSDPVDLSGWKLMDGITFTFPAGRILPAGGYLVVARNITEIQSRYPALASANLVGNFSGKLSSSGERVALARPATAPSGAAAFAVVDEVTYADGGRWDGNADGEGSSLELIDAHADGRRASNWAASDESGKGQWQTFSTTGVLDLGAGTCDQLHIVQTGEGECLVDDVQVVPAGGTNLVPNSTFSGSSANWNATGTHAASSLSAAGDSYDVRADGGGDTGPNAVHTTLSSALTNGSTATISARVKWISGRGKPIFRLRGNYLELLADLAIPTNLGTPGAPNSRAVANAGPAIFDVKHAPVLPVANQAVTVTARVQDPDGLASLNLRYRLDPSATVTTIAMNDSGTGGDAVAGDGVYTATLPGSAAGTLFAYRIEAADGVGKASVFPADAPTRECLVRVGESQPEGVLSAYRMWMTQATRDAWANDLKLSDRDRDVTFVLDDQRVVYNAAARYRGSPFTRPGDSAPDSGNLASYVVDFPGDDLVLGAGSMNLDNMDQPGNDPSLQGERLAFWFAEQLGVPFSRQRFVRIFVNGNQRGQVYGDSQQLDSDYIKSWFSDDRGGDFHKIDDWFEFDDTNANMAIQTNGTLEPFYSGGALKKARYRWSWDRKRSVTLDDNYDPLFALVNALNSSPAVYESAVERVVDVNEWVRIFTVRRIVGDWDSYGWERGKNMSTYRPTLGRWNLLPWDIDRTYGPQGRPYNSDLFAGINDPTMNKLLSWPRYRRLYLRALQEAANGPMQTAAVRAVMDPIYSGFTANGVTAASPDDVVSWLDQRRAFILSSVASSDAAFAITTNGGAAVTTNTNTLTLDGTASLKTDAVLINGVLYRVTWTSVNTWRVTVVLQAGAQTLSVTPVDAQGAPIAGAGSQSISVTNTGATESPTGHLVLSEIMYAPAIPNAEYVEVRNTSATTAYDLGGYRITGIDYDFPSGTVLAANSALVVARDLATFSSAYSDQASGALVLGPYAGTLSPDGEQLQLVRKAVNSTPQVTMSEVTYSKDKPWAQAANEQGSSLQLVDATRDSRRVGNWRASTTTAEYRPGLCAQYWTNITLAGSPTLLRDDATVNFDWGTNAPDSTVPRTNFSVRWSGVVIPERSETYTFYTTSDDGIRLWLDGQLVIDDWSIHPASEKSVTRVMQAGVPCRVQVEYYQGTGSAEARLRWSSPSTVKAIIPAGYLNASSQRVGLFTNSGLHADYWSNMALSGTPTLSRSDRRIDFQWGNGSPDASLPNDGFSARWTGIVIPEFSETYTFYANSDDGSRIYVDGKLIVDNWFDQAPAERSGTIALTAGVPVRIRVEYYENGGGAVGEARWSSPSTTKDYIPPGYFSAASGRDVGLFNVQATNATPGTANSTTASLAAFPPLRINEVQTNDATGILDGTGHRGPWLEIFNETSAPVSLDGLYLSNSYDDLLRWAFPSGSTVPANGHFIVWLDGRSVAGTVGEPHTSFALSVGTAGGVALSRPGVNGPEVIDYLTFPALAADRSFGSYPDSGKDSLATFVAPTPGAVNQPNVPTLTEVFMPQVMQGMSPDNSSRVPVAYRARLEGLLPNAVYRYGNRFVSPSDPVSQDGAGHTIFVKTDGSPFIRTTDGPRFQVADLDNRCSTFATDGNGSFTGWFVTVPSGNARFAAGATGYMRIFLNDGANGTDIATTLTAPSAVNVVNFGGAGTAVWGNSTTAPKNFVLLFDNREGTGRPLACVPVENLGSSVDSSYASFYRLNAADQPQRWGAVIPANLASGVRRVEERSLATGGLLSATVFLNGASGTVSAAATATGVQLDLQNSFAAYMRQYLSSGSLTDPAMAGENADPDHDGLSNLLEYALGGQPLQADPSIAPRLEIMNNHATLVFPRNNSLSSINYRVRASNNLTDWSATLFDSATGSSSNNEGANLRVTDPQTVSGQSGGRFLRLEIYPRP